MHKTTQNVGSFPIAEITKSKNFLKSYNEKSNYYLNNGDEFEVMLFNPTQDKYLAKIKINDKDISSSGIVINPGQRVFLERFIDEAKKFKFETYNVDDNSIQVQDAIKNNGDVKIEFYKEITYQPNYNLINVINTPNRYDHYPKWDITCGSSSIITDNSSSLYNGTLTSTANYTFVSGIHDFTNVSYTNTSIVSNETGRIEKGGESKQSFTNDNSNFNSFYNNIYVFKILPYSKKPIEVSEIRNYCSCCGIRIKSSNWKFCPKCGTKVE